MYGQPVELRVQHRTSEPYPGPAATPMAPFAGSGNRLGAPTTPSPAVAGPSTPFAAAPTAEGRGDYADSIQTKFDVDMTQPTYRIRLRLANGQMCGFFLLEDLPVCLNLKTGYRLASTRRIPLEISEISSRHLRLTRGLS